MHRNSFHSEIENSEIEIQKKKGHSNMRFVIGIIEMSSGGERICVHSLYMCTHEYVVKAINLKWASYSVANKMIKFWFNYNQKWINRKPAHGVQLTVALRSIAEKVSNNIEMAFNQFVSVFLWCLGFSVYSRNCQHLI